MTKTKKPDPPEFIDHYRKVTDLIEGVKIDSLTQFGEIKKEFGSIGHRLDNHQGRLTKLEEDKLKRDTIEEYKKSNESNKAAGSNGKAYNDNSGSLINKELLNALKYLGLVIAALAAAIAAMKVKP